MLTPNEDRFCRANAYVPEHVVSLVTGISGGEPFLLEDYLCYRAVTTAIIVGYPLGKAFSIKDFSRFLDRTISLFAVDSVWIMAPEIPEQYAAPEGEHSRDQYYTLNMDDFAAKGRLMRETTKALEGMTVTRSRLFGPEHRRLAAEFMEREKPGPLISGLYNRMDVYVASTTSAIVLEGRDGAGILIAFYVIDLGAHQFATYVVGCHSREHYVSHASDALFLEMVRLGKEEGKAYIHLGLGVNAGIRRFKEKWGGTPSLPYEYSRYRRGIMQPLSILKSLESML
jgi:hypothetical protein